jgi:selenocysteine-specific translation elongation factor
MPGHRPLTVTLLGSRDLGSRLAKAGTKSDLTLYHAVQGDLAVTYVEPSLFPERLPPLLAALSLGEQVILAVERIDRDLAEAVVTADLAGKDEGLLALGETVGESDVRPILKGTALDGYPVVPLDPREVRGRVERFESHLPEGELAIPVDHVFPVKGVGTVVLGVVRGRSVKVHERLRLYPSERSVEVRSIQVHDEDVPEALRGERVGLALKGVEAGEVSRGEVLAPEGSLRVEDLLQIERYQPCRFFKGKAGEGDRVHVGLGLSVLPGKIRQVDADRLTVALDRPTTHLPGERAFLVQLSGAGAGPRVAGRGFLP